MKCLRKSRRRKIKKYKKKYENVFQSELYFIHLFTFWSSCEQCVDEKNVDSWQLVYQKSKLYVEGIFIYCEIFILLLHSRRNSINCTIMRAFAATYFSCSGTIFVSSMMLNFVFITLKLRYRHLLSWCFCLYSQLQIWWKFIFSNFFPPSSFIFCVEKVTTRAWCEKRENKNVFEMFFYFFIIGDRFVFFSVINWRHWRNFVMVGTGLEL